VGLGLAPGEAAVLYFLLTLLGSMLFSVLFKALGILAQRKLFKRYLRLSTSLRGVAVLL
jgi:hypothetical protein